MKRTTPTGAGAALRGGAPAVTGQASIPWRVLAALAALAVLPACSNQATPDSTGRDSEGRVTASSEVGVTRLTVGDCIPKSELEDAPESLADAAKDDIQHVDVVPCDNPHAGEVVLVEDYPPASDGSYPGLEQLNMQGQERCATALEAYTGEPLDGSLPVTWLMPTQQDWDAGDHGLKCIALTVAEDGQTLVEATGSIRATQ